MYSFHTVQLEHIVHYICNFQVVSHSRKFYANLFYRLRNSCKIGIRDVCYRCRRISNLTQEGKYL